MTNVIPFARTTAADLTISSLEIAELTGKQHKHVIRDVRRMVRVLGNSSAQIWAEYRDRSGKMSVHAVLDRFHTEVLVTGYDIKRRAAVIQRWYDLEAGSATPWYQQKAEQAQPQLPDFTNPAAAARAWADEVEAKQLVQAELEVAEEELNRITVGEYIALTHRYMGRREKTMLGQRATQISRAEGEPAWRRVRP